MNNKIVINNAPKPKKCPVCATPDKIIIGESWWKCSECGFDRIPRVISSEFQQAENELQRVQNLLESAREEFLKTNNDLMQARTRNQQAQGDLFQSKKNLQWTQKKLRDSQDELIEKENALRQSQINLQLTQSILYNTHNDLQKMQNYLMYTQSKLDLLFVFNQIQLWQQNNPQNPITSQPLSTQAQRDETELRQLQALLSWMQEYSYHEREKIRLLQNELHEKQNSLQQTQNNLSQMKSTLSQTQSDLQRSQKDLYHTQDILKNTQKDLSKLNSKLFMIEIYAIIVAGVLLLAMFFLGTASAPRWYNGVCSIGAPIMVIVAGIYIFHRIDYGIYYTREWVKTILSIIIILVCIAGFIWGGLLPVSSR